MNSFHNQIVSSEFEGEAVTCVLDQPSGFVCKASRRTLSHEIDSATGGIIDRLRSVSCAVEFRVGTASWTDPTLVNSDLFYPPYVRSAEQRLRFYAEQFNTVEVDSTYYALPGESLGPLQVLASRENFRI
jgi:hypothetical protein